MIKAYIKSSKGNLLVKDEVTTLSVVLKDGTTTLPLIGYDIVWYKVHENGNYTNKTYGASITVKANDISSKAKYECRICDERNLTDSANTLLTDANGNQLTVDITLYSTQEELFKSNDTVDNFPINPEDYTILLANRSLQLLGQIVNIDYQTVNPKCNLNSADEINFTIYRELDNVVEPLWDKIIDLKIIYVRELDEFFQITVQTDEGSDKTTKAITGISLCEAELSQTNLNGIEINTENDIARDDYVVTKFYDEVNPKASLLHRILQKAPSYSIGHVDPTLKTLQRSFSVDGTDLYSFLTGDCADQFNCLFQFDSKSRTINVYDLYTNCLNPDCGYRGEFNDICPECGGTNISYFGEDTTIYVDKENLTDNISFTTNVDSIKNCFKIVGGDDNVTAAIRAILPSGTDYIYYLSAEQKDDMSQELRDKYDEYERKCAELQPNYIKLNQNLYDCYDKILYYTSGMMPSPDDSDKPVDSAEEIKKLTVANLNPVALTKVSEATSISTANAAVRNLAKLYIKSGYFKVEVDASKDGNNDFQYEGTDAQGYNYGIWQGRLIVTNYSDETDVATTDYMELTINDDYAKFIDQKIKKNIKKSGEKDGIVYNVLDKNISLEDFTAAIKKYSLNRVTSFHDAIQGALNVLIEADQASSDADLYTPIYIPYYNKLKACEKVMDDLQTTIKSWEDKQLKYEEEIGDIQTQLDMNTFFGEKLYNEFCLYRREDTYSNDNFISDGLSNEELLDKAKELIEDAKKELYKSGERQHSISATLDNLLVMDEFEPLVDHFKLGNWIRINCDGSIYRLRLTSYEINFGSLETINVEFSDVTKTTTGFTDIESIKKQASSLATNFSYVAKQAKQGTEANNSINKLLTNGLNASVTAIKSADTEDIVIGKNGIRLRAYDDIYTDYSPKQAAFIHNMLVFTRDNWRTAETALGEFTYTLNGQTYDEYGLQVKILVSPKIIAGDIYSSDYSLEVQKDGKSIEKGTHFNLNDGSFSLGSGKIVYNAVGNKLTLDKDIMIEYLNKDGTSTIKTNIGTVALNVDNINATYINANNLAANIAKIKFADIEKANIKDAFIDNLESRYIKTGTIIAQDGQFTKLYADAIKASVANIDLINTKEFTADSGFITSLGTITSNTVTSTVDFDFIKKAMIGHADISELYAGSFVVGKDSNGNRTEMNGGTMQFKDKNGNVYIQLGMDAKGKPSFLIKGSNGNTFIDESGLKSNAIADGLIVNDMLKQKGDGYNGIEPNRLNIDNVATSLSTNGNMKMTVDRVTYDAEGHTLDTYISQMDIKTNNLTNQIQQNSTFSVYIEAPNGNVLASASGNSTTLTCILKKSNDIIDSDGTLYRYVWRRKTANGGRTDSFSKVGKSITVTYNDISEDYIYYCDVEDVYNLVDNSGNQLIDASGNTLTAYYPFITANITISKDLKEELHTKYYTKEESKDSVITILGQTDMSTINGQPNSLVSKVNSTVETCDSITTTLSENKYTLGSLITQVNTNKSSINSWSSEISETKTSVTNAVNAVNKSIKLIEVQYCLSDSATELKNATQWNSTAPTWVDGKYIWSKSVATYNDGTVKDASKPACITGGKGQTGQQGQQGNPGADGRTGVGVSRIVPEYAISTSSTDAPTSGWSETEPKWTEGKYIWARSRIELDNGTTNYSTAILANAMNDALTKDGINLIRESETLSFDGYIIGNMLTDASGNVLTDASGNILVA